MILSGGCSPFRPDRLWRKRGRSSRACTQPRNPRAKVSPAPLCDVGSTCACAHRSRKTAQGLSGSAAKAGGVRASDRGAVRAPDHRQSEELWLGQAGDHARVEHSQHKGLNNRPGCPNLRRHHRPGHRCLTGCPNQTRGARPNNLTVPCEPTHKTTWRFPLWI
jgi:hypothetical protein